MRRYCIYRVARDGTANAACHVDAESPREALRRGHERAPEFVPANTGHRFFVVSDTLNPNGAQCLFILTSRGVTVEESGF